MRVKFEVELDVEGIEDSKIGVLKEFYYSVLREAKNAHQKSVKDFDETLKGVECEEHIKMVNGFRKEHQVWVDALKTCEYRVVDDEVINKLRELHDWIAYDWSEPTNRYDENQEIFQETLELLGKYDR